MSEQKHIETTDTQLSGFLLRYQQIEDRLVLASLPVVVFSLILWGVASAFPVTGTVVNFIISILLLLTVCVMLLRLVEIAWHWADALKTITDEVGAFYVFGIIGIGLLLIMGIASLIDMLTHAGSVTISRTALFVAMLLLLVLQYRAIIYRHLSKEGRQ